MVLDGSGKEGIHVDSMQDEAQQSQQVSGETDRHTETERESKTCDAHALMMLVPMSSLNVSNHLISLSLSLSFSLPSLSFVDIPVSSMEGPGMNYQSDFMETPQPHSMSSSQGTHTSLLVLV